MMKTNTYNQLEAFLIHWYSSETTKSYLYSIERFLNHYPNAKRLRLPDIESYFKKLKLEKKGVGYRTVTLASVKAYYNFLIDAKTITEHPCKSYFIGEKKPTGKDFSSMLTMKEMELLFSLREERYRYMENRNRAIIGLLIYQGLTSGELINLKVSNIDLDAGTVKVRGGGKNKGRTLGLKSSQITMLLRYIEQDRPELCKTKTSLLFVGMRGTGLTVDSLHAFINGMNGAFDKEMSPKNIRNSVICYWLNERKMPLEDVQIMAGHRYPSSTEKYIREDIDEQREAVSSLHQMIFQ